MQFRLRKLLLVLLAGVRILPKDEKTLPHQYNHSLKQKKIFIIKKRAVQNHWEYMPLVILLYSCQIGRNV